MAEQFLTFRRFHEEETAIDLIQKLNELNIEFEVEDNEGSFDSSFAKKAANRDISIKLKPADFDIAQKELENYYRFLTRQVDTNYYLFEFTNKELKEVLEKPYKWSDFDYQLARKILKDRGKEMSAELMDNLQKKRNDELVTPESYRKGWINFGYFSAIAGGLFGIIIGWHLCYSKKTLPDGRRAHSYSEWERKHGKQILLLGGIFFPIWLMIYIR
jgi:hypothetical protein